MRKYETKRNSRRWLDVASFVLTYSLYRGKYMEVLQKIWVVVNLFRYSGALQKRSPCEVD